MKTRSLLAATSLLITSALVHAQNIQVAASFARATVPQQKSAGAYVTLENKGKEADRLVGASTPVATSVEIHTMAMEGNVMRMREVGPIKVEAGAKVQMRPGEGYHLMLMGLREPLKAGETFPLTLQFEKAGKIELKVPVENARGGHGSHGGHGGHGAPAKH